jgi:hypothetical protein
VRVLYDAEALDLSPFSPLVKLPQPWDAFGSAADSSDGISARTPHRFVLLPVLTVRLLYCDCPLSVAVARAWCVVAVADFQQLQAQYKHPATLYQYV